MRIGLETKIFNNWLARVLAGFLVCLLGQAEAKQTNFIAKGGSAIFQNVNLHELKILSLEGHGTVNLVFEPHSSKDASNAQPNREIFVYENRWAILPKLDSTFNLKITCQVEADCKLTAELLETEADRSFLPATSQNHLSLDFPPGFKGDVSFLVLLKALYKSSSATFSGKNQPKLRFETFAQQAGVGVSEGYFARDSRFDMRVFEKDKQTPISKNTTQLGMNLYATLESRDKDYHWAESAVYRVVLSAQSITTSMFSLELVPEVQVLDLSELHKTYSEVRVVADQVYPGTAVKYEVILPRFTSAQFDLVPVEGNPDIFINPDENLGWEPSKYQYKSERDLRESITITETELKLNNKTAKKLYVVVNSKVESTYTLNLELRPQNYSEIGTRGMRPNTFYSGTVLNNQVINFVLEFYVVIPEVISSYISLKARTGNPDLYIKDCEELSTCEFTLEEIDKLVKQDKERIKSGKTDTSSGMYFKYSDSLQNSDDLYFEMNMVPYGSAKYTETTGNQLPNFANKLKTSKHNRICVGVVGHANTLSKVSEYTLIAKTRGGHGVVSEYRSEFIYLGPSDEKFIIYSPLHLPDEVQGIIAKFDVSHGDASVYFSTANKFPSSKSHDMALEIDNDQQALESMTRYMHIPRSKLSSQVYFGINAKKQTLINMLITYWTPEPKAGESIRLIPGVPIITKVTTLDQFTVKLFKNAENARNKDAYIKVVSQFGVLRVCAARIKNPSDSVTKADCEYDSLDELLHIPVDRIDSDQSDWIIFVEPAGSKYSSILPMLHQDSSVEYKIELLTSRSISPLEGSGKVTEGIVTDGEGVIHYHDFWLEQNTQYVWVHIQSIASSNLFATASFNKTEVYRIANIGPYGTYAGMSEGSNQGYTFVFKSQEIRKFCEVPKAEYQYPPRNLQQDHKDGPSGLPKIRPAVVCKVFIRVSAGFQTQDLSTLTSKQYRVLFAKDTDTIHLQPGKVYTLPAPLKSRMLITSETKNYQNGITASVKSLSSNLIGSITAKLVSIKDGSEKFEVKPIMQKIRFYQTLILPTESFKNAPKDSEDLKATTWVSLERNSELQPSYEQVPSDMDSPVHPHSSISIIFESQVNILELGTPIQGIAHQGSFVYYTLKVNSSEDTTLILQTTKNTDADIFIQKGTSLPTPTSYYLKSTNFASDEITIPRNENSGMTNKTVYYTVGVYGVTSNCAYTLVAISNTFRVINYDLGQIVSSSMSNTNPLVLRVPPHLEGVPLRVFFYSGTSGVKLMLVNESDEGILRSIPPHSSNSSIVQFLKAQGIAGVYKFPVKKHYDFSTRSQSLLVFYPDQYFGSVSAVIAHPNLPVKYKEGQDPFYFKLDKDENITISVSALNPGELSQMKFILHGSRKEDYVLTFDKTKFKQDMVVNKGNAQEYKFTDNNPNDNEAVLEITIVSKKMGSTYRLSVSESKSMMRAVPSETHKVLLTAAPRDNTSAPKAVEYHFEEPKFSNLRSLKLFLVSPSDKSVQVSLRIRKQVVNQFTYEDVSLDQQLFQRNGVTYFGVNSQSLTVRKGVYILSLTNTNKEATARVQFRFIFNDVLEMEANGMTTGYLNNSARDIIQIAYPTQSELTLSFLSCSGKMNVSYSRNELDYGNPGTQIFKEEVGANSSVFELKNFTTYNTESDVYYIQIQSLDKEPAEYALLSRQHDYAAAADSSDMIKLGKLVSVTNNQVAKHLDFNFETPVLSPESIKKVYPQATRLVIQLTAVIYGGINQVEGQVEAKIMRGIYCPKSFDREPDLIRATAQIEAAEGEFYTLPTKITIRKQVSDEYHQKLMQQGMIISFGDIGRVIPIATLYIYEKDDLEPSGIAVVHGSPTKVDASSLFVIENGLPPGNYLDTLTGKVTLIVAMLMSMLLVLTAVYFCAHRISGGYKRIEGEVKLTPDLNSSGAEMTGLKRIEETRPDESA